MKKSLLTLLLAAAVVRAERYPLPPPDVQVIGSVQRAITAQEGETFVELARRYGVGYDALEKVNQGLDGLWLRAGEQVIIPSRMILPDAPREGIVINLPEMRLYYYPPGEPYVDVYAIGIGREGWETPTGKMSIIEKRANPTWTPPASIRAEHAAQGDILPAVVPAGPDNPLGLFALRLSNPSYLIHGTNKPEGVGMRVSHGCIRMYPEGVEDLFKKVGINTPVNIVDQPMKVGHFADQIFLEFHLGLDKEAVTEEDVRAAQTLVEKRLAGQQRIAPEIVRQVVHENTGLPVEVSAP